MTSLAPVLVSGLCLVAALASPMLQEAATAPPEHKAPALDAAHEHVTPGLVAWHADRAAALAAAQESGRPVLLFQMLGRLDERFC